MLLEKYKQLHANPAQVRAMLAMHFCRIFYLIWGRGTGKSFYIGWFMVQVVRRLPGSKWAFVGPTYTKLLIDILPGIVAALQRLGYEKDVHYFLGKEPPKAWNWNPAYSPPLDYKYAFTFFHKERCTVFQLVSQDRDISGRGVNYDGVIADEGLIIKKDHLEKSVLATNRGNDDIFKREQLHHAVLICSSMPFTQTGKWLLDAELEAKKDPRIYYSLANAFENIGYGVDIQYIKDQRKLMTPLTFDIEMLNMRIRKVDDGFYPNFSTERHVYEDRYNYSFLDGLDITFKERLNLDCRADADYLPDKPLDIGVDWGGKINTAIISQDRLMQKGTALLDELRIINAMYVKAPDILDHLAEKIAEYYRFHKHRVINLYYDTSGNVKWGNSQLTMAEQFRKKLAGHDWKVNLKSISGNNKFHQEKYMFINRVLQNSPDYIQDPELPVIQVPRDKGKDLIISIQQAPLKEGRNGIEKDKGSEKKKDFAQEHATHFSDVFDILILGKYGNKIKGNSRSFAPTIVVKR